MFSRHPPGVLPWTSLALEAWSKGDPREEVRGRTTESREQRYESREQRYEIRDMRSEIR
jgi:hypothetical protein